MRHNHRWLSTNPGLLFASTFTDVCKNCGLYRQTSDGKGKRGGALIEYRWLPSRPWQPATNPPDCPATH